MMGVGVTQDVALDRNEWRRRTSRLLGLGDRENAIKVSKVFINATDSVPYAIPTQVIKNYHHDDYQVKL